MRTILLRALMITVVAGVVLLVPACQLRDGALQVTGPSISPEVAAAISVAASAL